MTTNPALQFILLLTLTASVILQFCAAFFAFRIVKFSRKALSWILISLALLLMAVRRAITFYGLISGGTSCPVNFYAELIALVISLLLVIGLFSIAPLFRRVYSPASENLRDLCGTHSCELAANISNAVAVYEAVDKGLDFIIRDMNPAAERIEKTARQHAVGRRLTEVLPGVEKFGLLEVLRRVWKTGRPENFPLRYYQDERISGWRDTFVYRRPAGEVVAVYSDVSAQMHMQEELERRERKFRMLFEQAPLPYQSLDREGRIIEVNPAWLCMTGLERAAAVGRPFNELLTRAGRQQFQACLAGLKKDGSASDAELELRRNDGTLLKIQLNALSVRGGTGGIEQIHCILHQETGHETGAEAGDQIGKRAREMAMELLDGGRRELQRKRLEMLGGLAAGMANELNTPLTAARNAFNLMRDAISPSNPHYEFAGMASQELTRMADIIERLYRFHQPVSPDCEQININAMLDNALILVRTMMRERRIQLRDERTATVPLVRLPPGAVMPVLVNPIKNSMEAMPPDGVLTLRTGGLEQGGVFVEIEDNGPGIPPEFLPHLFEPFTTFRHSGRGYAGLGLGMTMVQHTLDALGGSVTVRSGTGEGTCVRIILPASVPAGGL
jgi:PAS domain S-box-containing protein